MSEPYVNRFGRTGGRGIRPWLLIPKILGFVVYVGGFCAVLTLWLSSDFTSLELHDPRRAQLLDLISHILIYMVVPAASTTIIFGILLLLQHPGVFLRQRWMQVKLISLLTIIPTCHFYARAQFTTLKTTADKLASDAASPRFAIATAVAIAGSALVIAIARLKPRLGRGPIANPLPAPSGPAISTNDR